MPESRTYLMSYLISSSAYGSQEYRSLRESWWEESEPLYKLKGEFFKTLGHPARIRILELLTVGDRSVGELLPEVGLESSNLSQQLGVLRRAGVVEARKDGNAVIYSIASPDIAELLAVARRVLTGMLSDRVRC